MGKLENRGIRRKPREWNSAVEHSGAYFGGRSISYVTFRHIRRPVFRAVPAQGEHVPFDAEARYSFGMNTRLTETQIRRVCVEMLARDPNVSGRKLRRELLNRFGAVGKTERVFAVWREEAHKARPAAQLQSLPTDIRELLKRLSVAEAAAAQNLARAELAEYRERAHQDHWAMEIDRVKRELEEARSSAADGQGRGSKPFQV
jgi:hypothetical protein